MYLINQINLLENSHKSVVTNSSDFMGEYLLCLLISFVRKVFVSTNQGGEDNVLELSEIYGLVTGYLIQAIGSLYQGILLLLHVNIRIMILS